MTRPTKIPKRFDPRDRERHHAFTSGSLPGVPGVDLRPAVSDGVAQSWSPPKAASPGAHAWGVACSATHREYAESTQLLRTRYYSADSNRQERPGHSVFNATVEATKPLLDVEAELHHVAVLGVVVLALDTDLAELLGLVP